MATVIGGGIVPVPIDQEFLLMMAGGWTQKAFVALMGEKRLARLVGEGAEDILGNAAVKGGSASSGAENSALYSKLKDQLIRDNLANIAAQDARLAAAVKGNGAKNPNFSLGQGTLSEADALGKIWVGDGAKKTTDGLGLISVDGTRVYRPPAPKNSPFATTGIQANFESYSINPVTGQRVKISNGHLNIDD
ncbi:MAG: hypothetical protein ACRER8_08390 [Pseudomonas sp.]|uniref:hypothetical protein n=1 Tax=Pseudomonas sp. TaxID=306 RepID=UPI003D6FA322